MNSESSLTANQREWKNLKSEYLEQVLRSHDSILKQLDSAEVAAREAGDDVALNNAKEARQSFVEAAEIPKSIDRKEYDAIREAALTELTAGHRDLLNKVAKVDLGKFGRVLIREFKQLSNPIVSDAQARGTAAVDSYRDEITAADALVTAALDDLENTARKQLKSDELNSIKKARAEFIDIQKIPTLISRRDYDSKRKQAIARLQEVNDELVRAFSKSELESQAKRMSAQFERVTSPRLAVENNTFVVGADPRRRWNDKTNKTTIEISKGDRWREVLQSNGKNSRRLQEKDRTDDYVELLFLDRKQLIRLYDDHADMKKGERWERVSDGNWGK